MSKGIQSLGGSASSASGARNRFEARFAGLSFVRREFTPRGQATSAHVDRLCTDGDNIKPGAALELNRLLRLASTMAQDVGDRAARGLPMVGAQ